MNFPIQVSEDPTAEEIATKGLAYLNSLKQRCMVGDKCVYQKGEGEEERCVAGAFMPNGHPALKRNSDLALVLQRYDDLPGWMYEHKQVLFHLQTIHDLPTSRFTKANLARVRWAKQLMEKHNIELTLDGPLFK